ncbi:MAG: hypothetical protein K0S32_329 [Bacteroidetes bacterium]|jgi:hypothetical protein|nr:hypothetical protein [Bacteroidota bacterium]
MLFDALYLVAIISPFVIFADFRKKPLYGVIYILVFFTFNAFVFMVFSRWCYSNLWLLFLPILLPFIVVVAGRILRNLNKTKGNS